MKSEKKTIIIFIVCAVAVVVGLVCYGIHKNNLAEQEHIETMQKTQKYRDNVDNTLKEQNQQMLNSTPHTEINF